ncbi:MAG: glycosyltransferase family 9 protein [Nitrospinota bacterium]
MAARPYPYHSMLRRGLARCADAFGDALIGKGRNRTAEPPHPDRVRRVLVIRPDHLGDVVFSTAAFKPLRDLYPRARLTAVVGPWSAPLLLHHPYVDGVVSFRNPWFERGKSSRRRDIFDLLQWMRRSRFDVGLDLRGDPRVIALLAAGRVRYRVGYGWAGAGFLLSHELEHKPGVHQVERNLAVVRALGWKPADAAHPTPLLRVSDAEREGIDRRLAPGAAWDSPGIGAGRGVAVVHPGAGFPTKRWRPDRFGALVRWLAGERGYRVALVGSEEERNLAGEVSRSAGSVQALDLTGRLSLRELMALVSRADLMVGNDSGPTHIAAALGTKVVALFSGTNDVGEWFPVGPRTRVVRKVVPCSPCGLKVCTEYNHECMESLSVEEAQEAVLACESS